VFRDDYLLALRALSRATNPSPLVRAMDCLQEFTARLPMRSYENALHALTEAHAFLDPDEGRLRMPAV